MDNSSRFQGNRFSYVEAIIIISISVALALLIYAPHLLDLSVPAGGDVRAHIFKIDTLYDNLSHWSWPQWNPYWYHGFPAFQYYPPGFYCLGAVLTFITGYAVISYKLLLLFVLISNGLAACYFSRKFLKLSLSMTILCLVAYQSSTSLFICYAYGTAPNLLSWSVSVIFLTFYLCNVSEEKVYRPIDIVIPGLLFGITALIHPYPALFSIMAVIIFHMIWIVRHKSSRKEVGFQLLYFTAVFCIGALVATHYWLPAMLTWDYVSPIYGFGGIAFFLPLTLLALTMGLIIRWRIASDIRLDLLVAYVILASTLGFGLSRYAPFGLGSLIHGFRFATMVAPFFGILLVAYSLNKLLAIYKINRLYIATISICLILITSVIPVLYLYETVPFRSLFHYAQNYHQPEYAQLLESAKNDRLIVSLVRGYLAEGDSPVTFGWRYDVETVNGPYNQGDPKFFKHTVHLEWEERWLNHKWTRENLMQESDAKYIFLRNLAVRLANTKGLTCIVDNSYGQLWELDESVTRAVSVTPILLDVQEPEIVTEFFNILLPEGYRMVFVSVDGVSNDLKEKFEYVILDNESKISDYESKVVFLLNNTDQHDNLITDEEGIVKLNLPYITYTNKFFYRGDKGDITAWRDFDREPGSQLDSKAAVMLQQASSELSEYLQNLKYEPANYKFDKNRIQVETEPGFTLVKDSYFPYWNTNQDEVLSTSQGFMLIYSDDAIISLSYEKPAMNTIATIVSLTCLAISLIVLVVVALSRLGGLRKENQIKKNLSSLHELD